MNVGLKNCVLDSSVKKRVLLIDDNTDIVTLLQYSLEDICGWSVITANSGREGLIKANTETIDAIILDGIMPDMDGLMFLQTLKNLPEKQNLPVILLTGSMTLTEQINALGFHLSGTIIKPFDPLSICEKIAQFLGWTLEEI